MNPDHTLDPPICDSNKLSLPHKLLFFLNKLFLELNQSKQVKKKTIHKNFETVQYNDRNGTEKVVSVLN